METHQEETVAAGILEVDALVIYCCDPRQEVNLWKRIKKYLLVPHRTRATGVGILGGPISLAYPDYLPIEYALLTLKQIPFALRKFPKITKIIVVGHDCGYYDEIPGGSEFPVEKKMKDLRRAAALLRRLLPKLKVSAFFANEEDDGFKRIRR